MIRQLEMNAALQRWNSPGRSLRRARSPVAPTSTTTCGSRGPTREVFFITYPLSSQAANCKRAWRLRNYLSIKSSAYGAANGFSRRNESVLKAHNEQHVLHGRALT